MLEKNMFRPTVDYMKSCGLWMPASYFANPLGRFGVCGSGCCGGFTGIPCTSCVESTPRFVKIYNSSTDVTCYVSQDSNPCLFSACPNWYNSGNAQYYPKFSVYQFPLSGSERICHQEYTTGSYTYTPLEAADDLFGESGKSSFRFILNNAKNYKCINNHIVDFVDLSGTYICEKNTDLGCGYFLSAENLVSSLCPGITTVGLRCRVLAIRNSDMKIDLAFEIHFYSNTGGWAGVNLPFVTVETEDGYVHGDLNWSFYNIYPCDCSPVCRSCVPEIYVDVV